MAGMRAAAMAVGLLVVGCGDAAAPPAAGPLVGATLVDAGAETATPPARAPVPAEVPPAPAAVESPPVTPVPAPATVPAAAATATRLPLDFAALAAWDVARIRLPSKLPPVPEALQALHGRRVAISGYVVPDRMREGHKILTALFIKHLAACCFGTIPKLNEWVHLQIELDAEIDFNLRRPARVEGTFLIGPHSTGEVSHSLFRIVVTRIIEDEEYHG